MMDMLYQKDNFIKFIRALLSYIDPEGTVDLERFEGEPDQIHIEYAAEEEEEEEEDHNDTRDDAPQVKEHATEDANHQDLGLHI